MAQTVIQNRESIPFGSVKFEMGDSVDALVDMGVGQNANFEESWEETWLAPDNGAEELLGIRNHKCTFTMDLWEFDLAKFHNLRGGLDTLTTSPGTLVSGATQTVNAGSWHFNQFIRIANQNGDQSPIAVSSVSGSVAGALVEGTDYINGQNALGESGILVVASSAVATEDQVLTILYEYTPNAARTLSTGGLMTIRSKVVQLTNVGPTGKILRLRIFKATNGAGITLAFKADNAEEPNVIPITFNGVRDSSRAAGAQLFEIYNEQGA